MERNYKNASEKRLIKEILKGNSRAYGELYLRYVDEIYRYVYFRTARNREEAEDITQEVFLRAWKTVSRDETDRYNFRSLTYKIARNLTIDRWRTRKDEIALNDVEAEQLKSRSPDPEEKMVMREKLDNLKGAIRELAPLKQDVIICRIINHLTHAETAKALGLAEGHVRVLQHRALKELRITNEQKYN